MPRILSGQLTAFFLYDVAEAADLSAVQTHLGDTAHTVRLTGRPAIPAYVRYQNPPVQVDASALGLAPIEDFQTRIKVYDYGVVSLSLSRPLSGEWTDLIALGHSVSSSSLYASARECCEQAVRRFESALQHPRETYLAEDYFVFGVTSLDDATSADELMAAHGHDIAQLLRGEAETLSAQERDEVLRHHLSYFTSDLVVPTWNGAFVYDTEAGLAGALEVLEFANSQLLQYRYYDLQLDAELERIYARLQTSRWYEPWIGRRYTAAARELHALFIDVNELTDRTANALKLVGDVYAARLLGLTAARLGLDAWKDAVKDKLKTLDDIYRFAVNQTGMDRGEMLEAAIVLILLFELVLFFMGIMT